MMVNTESFYDCLIENEFDFFTGVPDSLLKELCLCIKNNTTPSKNIITANEGNALSLACGVNIASSKVSVVYMQNSGLGNIVNPLLSLADEKVYNIPMLLIIGYRGEKNVPDEPQHIKQGELTLPLLETLGVKYLIVDENYEEQIKYCKNYIEKNNRPIALIVRKDTFSKYSAVCDNGNTYEMTREEALDLIISNINDDDFVVSTTGKTSREIFEIREKYGMSHGNDFLTVGSMGHTSSLALGISLYTEKNIFCIDGDGSMIMHMGGLAVAINNAKSNYKYILINNGCHESVGGQKTIAYDIDVSKILEGFGFKNVIEVKNRNDLKEGLKKITYEEKSALIIYTNDKSRSDLSRPTTTPIQNKEAYIKKIRK